jgi:hypothetical protein
MPGWLVAAFDPAIRRFESFRPSQHSNSRFLLQEQLLSALVHDAPTVPASPLKTPESNFGGSFWGLGGCGGNDGDDGDRHRLGILDREWIDLRAILRGNSKRR